MATFNATQIAARVVEQLGLTPGFSIVHDRLTEDERQQLQDALAQTIRLHAGDCLSRCQDDEPIFVLCARDLLAPSAVRAWAASVSQLPVADRDKISGALHCASSMEMWKGPKKLPGTSKSERIYTQ